MATALDREVTITVLGEQPPPRAELLATARLVGLKDFTSPTLEAVERRRWQLWLVSIVSLLGASALLTIASVWPELLKAIGIEEGRLTTASFRVLVLVLTVVFAGYTAEKEVNLRKLTRLLIDERVLTAALSNRLSEVSALLDAGKAMNSVLELDAVLDIILNSATTLLEAEGGSIMLSGDEAGSLRSVCVRGNQFAVGAVVAPGEGIAGRVARSWEPLLVTGQMGGRRKVVDTAMCVPLIHRGGLLGVLNINGTVDRRFTEYDLRALSLFAEQAASAIANARLYEVERLHVAELVEGELRKTEFLAAVSHDLRTPLTSLIGCTKMLQQANLAEHHRVELAAMIDRQAIRLNRMIEDLLTAARLEAESPPPLVSVDLVPLVCELADEFRVTGRAVSVELPAGSAVVPVQGRADSLRRVLTNLVDNALKHGGTRVVIRVDDRLPDNDSVDVLVIDDGPGVAAEDRERIFERFSRLDENRQTPGIGLGLSIVQGLVVACGGKVWCEAPAGHGEGEARGTVMRVRLRPAGSAPAAR
ncbi:MAG TPA: ATP-binding protein [Acidimicrobiales bacterium]|nr:ATP-binding protein [Acidimicrobiales bacterium]